MINKRRGFLRFIFSFMPGAAEMYMGFMKMGISLMGAFFFTVFAADFFNIESVLLISVIIWFYSFFHAHNLAGMPEEEFYASEDDYIFNLSDLGTWFKNKNYNRKVVAWVLIVVGIVMIYRTILREITWVLPDRVMFAIHAISNMVPSLIFAVVIIVIGIKLILGKKHEIYDDIVDEIKPDTDEYAAVNEGCKEEVVIDEDKLITEAQNEDVIC